MNKTVETLPKIIHSKWCKSELEDFRFRFLNNLLDNDLQVIKALESACFYLNTERNKIYYNIEKYKKNENIIKSLMDSASLLEFLIHSEIIQIKRYVDRSIMIEEREKIDCIDNKENILVPFDNLSDHSKSIVNSISKICYDMFIVNEDEFKNILATQNKINLINYIEKNVKMSSKYYKIEEYLNYDYIKLYNWYKEMQYSYIEDNNKKLI